MGDVLMCMDALRLDRSPAPSGASRQPEPAFRPAQLNVMVGISWFHSATSAARCAGLAETGEEPQAT